MELVLPSSLIATGLVNGVPVRWGERIDSPGPRAGSKQLGGNVERTAAFLLREEVIRHAAGKQPLSPVLPLISYYGTGRLWQAQKPARSKNTRAADTSRFSGYTDCLASASTFQFFESWFKRFSYEAQSEVTSGRASPHKPGERLQAVRAAVSKVLAPSGSVQLC